MSARRTMYPRRPWRMASERGRVATCCHRLGDRPTHNMRSPPASGRLTRSRAETRGHGGFLELACAHLNHAACNLHGLVAKPRLRQAQPSRIFAKQHRFTDSRRGSLVATAIAMVLQVPLHGKKRPDRAKHLLSRPLLCRPKGVSVCSVVKNTLPSGHHVDETARKPTSKPLSVPPCLRLLRVNRPEANRTPRAEGSAGTSHAGPDGHTIPTRTCTHACFISAEQSLHTAATYNHAT